MIDETIKRIEHTVASSETLASDRKSELLDLIADLKNEIETLDESQHEALGSVARYTEASIREAVKEDKDDELLDYTLNGLSLSVRRFEVSHPTLMNVINNIGQTLSSSGI